MNTLRRLTVSLGLLLLCLPAWAQIEAPPCFPLINGVHAMVPRVVDGEVGRHVFWACSPRGGSARVYGWSCQHGQCLPGAVQAAHATILASTARLGAAQVMYRESMAFDCPGVIQEDTARGRLCRERDRLMRALAPEWVKDGAP